MLYIWEMHFWTLVLTKKVNYTDKHLHYEQYLKKHNISWQANSAEHSELG